MINIENAKKKCKCYFCRKIIIKAQLRIKYGNYRTSFYHLNCIEKEIKREITYLLEKLEYHKKKINDYKDYIKEKNDLIKDFKKKVSKEDLDKELKGMVVDEL